MIFFSLVDAASQLPVNDNSVKNYITAMDDMIQRLDTDLKYDQRTKDLEKALGEYKRKMTKGELKTDEEKRQYLGKNVQSIADEVQQLETKKAAGNK